MQRDIKLLISALIQSTANSQHDAVSQNESLYVAKRQNPNLPNSGTSPHKICESVSSTLRLVYITTKT